MARRFNPPPQWPQPPDGWTPHAGWQPDPAWPPVPPGWQFWLDDKPSRAAGALSWAKRHKIITGVSALFVVVLIGSAVTGPNKHKTSDASTARGKPSPTVPPSSSAEATVQPSPSQALTETATPRQTSKFTVVPGGLLPNRALTPGSVFAAATTSKICVSGYTKSVRNVTDEQRHQVFAAYGIPYAKHDAYEFDHLIPLELGGDNADTNLWPQPYADKDAGHKDALENRLHNMVCAKTITLSTAQTAIGTNWVAAYSRYGGAASATSWPSPTPTLIHRSPSPPPPPPTRAGSPPTFTTCGAPANPWGYNFCQRGSLIYNPAGGVCSYFSCIDNFSNGVGYMTECNDGQYSMSGGRSGACSHHGGEARPVYSDSGPH